MSTPFERYTNIALSQLGLPAGSEVYAASAEVEWYEDGWEHELEDEGVDPDELMSLSEAVDLVQEQALVSVSLPPGQMLVRARDPDGNEHAGVVTLVDDWQPIETAPLDERVMILVDGAGEDRRGDVTFGTVQEVPSEAGEAPLRVVNADRYHGSWNFSAWKPAPALPVGSAMAAVQ